MPTLCVVLPVADRAQLRTIVANGNTPQKLATRANIVMISADQVRPSHIATRLGLSRNHVHYWVRRYVALGVPGVMGDASRPRRKKRITSEQIAAIVNATLTTTPPGRTHWSTRTMARAHGVSEKTIRERCGTGGRPDRDGGIDGIIKEDRLGLDGIYVQAKRWDASVGRPIVQAFAGSLEGHRARKGVLITTSDFTADARDYVTRIEKRIVLISVACTLQESRAWIVRARLR